MELACCRFRLQAVVWSLLQISRCYHSGFSSREPSWVQGSYAIGTGRLAALRPREPHLNFTDANATTYYQPQKKHANSIYLLHPPTPKDTHTASPHHCAHGISATMSVSHPRYPAPLVRELNEIDAIQAPLNPRPMLQSLFVPFPSAVLPPRRRNSLRCEASGEETAPRCALY